MAKGYWKAVLAAAFFIVAGVCYGGSLFREGSIVLKGETEAGGAGVQTADGAEGSGPWAGEGAGSPGTHGAEAGPNTETESARAEVERPGYFVHICGQVKEPGVYELPEGSRVYEAVEAAGGFTEEAAAEALNLAEKITDGMKITVYDREEARTLEVSGLSESGGPGSGGLVNLNTAGKEALMTLSGIGESKAEDIIRYRKESGGFKKIEDIMKVPGIKNAGFQKIKDRITV